MSVPFDNIDGLKALVESELGVRLLWLRKNAAQGTQSQAYRGLADGGLEVFVKVGDPLLLDRGRAVLEHCRGLAFIPAVLDRGGLEIDGRRVQITEYKSGEQIVDPCRLTGAQFRSWIDGYVAFSKRIQALQSLATVPRISGFASTYSEVLRTYALQSRFAKWQLSDLLQVAERAESIDRHLTSVIHGDFTFYNYSFSEDGLAAIYDCDALTHGMPYEDLLFAFTCRFRDNSLRRCDRKKLLRMLSEMIDRTPWPREDCRAAIDLQRLKEAVGLIEDYANPVLFALKAARRDHRHAFMLKALDGEL